MQNLLTYEVINKLHLQFVLYKILCYLQKTYTHTLNRALV